jgi:hypothetical protein
MTELSGYQFRMLREDSELALFRGERAGDAVSILVLEPVAERPAPGSHLSEPAAWQFSWPEDQAAALGRLDTDSYQRFSAT